MELAAISIPAHVYKDDPAKDLALLKLARMPDGIERLPVIKLAKRVPRPGSECIAIGHPASAMLWTVRTGIISSAGVWPRDMIDIVITRLARTSSQDKKRLRDLLAKSPSRRVLISNCGINPGDSGGPLLDEDGNLVAVTFAIPSARAPGIASAAKFAYHVHLSEVKAFLADRPRTPLVHVPSPLPPAAMAKTSDLDRDGVVDTLIFGVKGQKQATGLLVDLDQDSAAKMQEATSEGRKLTLTEITRLWDYEFALHPGSPIRAFYDTDHDGRMDLILIDADRDKMADGQLQFTDGTWHYRTVKNQPILDKSLISDPEQRKRFVAIALQE